MVAKKYKTLKEKKAARSKVNAQNYSMRKAATKDQEKIIIVDSAFFKMPINHESGTVKGHSQSLSSSKHRIEEDDLDEIEYILNFDGETNRATHEYKALIGVHNSTSKFFSKLHSKYIKYGDAMVVVKADDKMQSTLKRFEYRLAILKLEAVDEVDAVRVQTGKHMYDEILGISRTLQQFRTAAIIGQDEVLLYMRTGRLNW
ncbi:hypothetical protein BT96DRAFT_945946 [Gymnopus androsaceus JB14]|uniref:Uncharacterized protein n=1 Tax=Gymnopus androsaceus JB14 TaxID=1447944 RepID=A0A6A4GZZ1_9AGAR|nr:hypothetical protein BT96DRAFT_945946 [Gymnopus androsaceus JB14]